MAENLRFLAMNGHSGIPGVVSEYFTHHSLKIFLYPLKPLVLFVFASWHEFCIA